MKDIEKNNNYGLESIGIGKKEKEERSTRRINNRTMKMLYKKMRDTEIMDDCSCCWIDSTSDYCFRTFEARDGTLNNYIY